LKTSQALRTYNCQRPQILKPSLIMSRTLYPRAAKTKALEKISAIIEDIDDEITIINSESLASPVTPVTTETPKDPVTSDTSIIYNNAHDIIKDEIYDNIRCSESIKIHEVNIMKDYLNMSSEASGKTLKYSPDMFKFIISHPYLLHYAKFNKVVKDKVDELYKEVDDSKKVSEQYKEEYKGICMTVKAITQLYSILSNKDIYNKNTIAIGNDLVEFTNNLVNKYINSSV